MLKIVLDKDVEEKIKIVAEKKGVGVDVFINSYFKNFSEKELIENKKGIITDFSIENFNEEDNEKIEGLSNFNLFRKTVSGM